MIDRSLGDSVEGYDFPVLHEGMRVRLRGSEWGLTLRADTGTVVRPTDDDGYYLIRLDTPALYDHGTGKSEEMMEIVEASDNLDILSD
jgi:hypothetical protein